MPISLTGHWAAAVLYPPSRVVEFFDSMHASASRPAFCSELEQLLLLWTDEVWTFFDRTLGAGVPGQPPGDTSNCGIFVAARLLEAAFELPYSFDASGVASLRLAFAVSITQGTLLSSAAPPFPTAAG